MTNNDSGITAPGAHGTSGVINDHDIDTIRMTTAEPFPDEVAAGVSIEEITKMHELLRKHDMPAYPIAAQKAGVGYTDYLTGAHDKGPFNVRNESDADYVYTPDRNRQCSIGYHEECSDPEGVQCGCVCHPLAALLKERVT